MVTVRTISYSALKDFEDCPKFYELRHVQKLLPFTNNPATIYGTLMHKYSTKILLGERTEDAAVKAFSRTWKKFYGLYGSYIDQKRYKREAYEKAGCFILRNIKKRMKEEFGSYKIIGVEKRIKKNLKEFPQKFYGFIDLLIKSEKKNCYVVIDLKTTDSSYKFIKFKNKFKDYQLALYKKFVLDAFGKDVEIKTYFVLFEKYSALKEDENKCVRFLEISCKNKKIANATKWMDKSLFAINKELFYKNRTHCHKYGRPCYFYKTKYCPAQKKV